MYVSYSTVMKKEWTDLVKIRIKELGMTQEKLAELIDVTPGGMGHWLNKRREPSLAQIAKILKVLDMTTLMLHSDGTLEHLTEVAEDISNMTKLELQPKYTAIYPLLSSVQAGEWSEALEPYPVDGLSDYYPTTETVSEHSFWLKVEGDSMTSSVGLSLPEGTLILVDPEQEAKNGSLVVAKLEEVNEATFKKLIIDAGQKFLKPLNNSYPNLVINGNCRIIGVVVDAKLKLF